MNKHEQSSSYYGLCLRIWFIRSVFFSLGPPQRNTVHTSMAIHHLCGILLSIHKEKENGEKYYVEKWKQTKLELDKTKPNKIGPRDIETCLTQRKEAKKNANFLFLTTNRPPHIPFEWWFDCIQCLINLLWLQWRMPVFVYIYIILCWAGHVPNRWYMMIITIILIWNGIWMRILYTHN